MWKKNLEADLISRMKPEIVDMLEYIASDMSGEDPYKKFSVSRSKRMTAGEMLENILDDTKYADACLKQAYFLYIARMDTYSNKFAMTKSFIHFKKIENY